MLGSGCARYIIDLLEQDLQVPVVHPVTARVWEFQNGSTSASRAAALAVCCDLPVAHDPESGYRFSEKIMLEQERAGETGRQ